MTDPRLLEPIAARGWPAAESAALGGWRLHAAAGQTGRINTCWPLAAPDRDVEAAIDAAEAWYAARGFAPRFKIVEGDGDPPDLADRLAARGYAAYTPTLTMVGSLAAAAPDQHASIAAGLDEAFLRVFADPAFGHDADARERLGALARIPAPRAFALIRVDGEPAAVGVGAVEGDWVGIMGMRTAPAFRRRGLARRIFRALTSFAAAAGAQQGYLQVEQRNAAAIALYESEGFASKYLYCYWAKT